MEKFFKTVTALANQDIEAFPENVSVKDLRHILYRFQCNFPKLLEESAIRVFQAKSPEQGFIKAVAMCGDSLILASEIILLSTLRTIPIHFLISFFKKMEHVDVKKMPLDDSDSQDDLIHTICEICEMDCTPISLMIVYAYFVEHPPLSTAPLRSSRLPFKEEKKEDEEAFKRKMQDFNHEMKKLSQFHLREEKEKMDDAHLFLPTKNSLNNPPDWI
jgi:hypothetical protein